MISRYQRYPIGATWEAVDRQGCRGRIYLRNIHGNGLEHWEWSFCYADGSSSYRHRDWTPSRRKAVEECGIFLHGKARFKRIK